MVKWAASSVSSPVLVRVAGPSAAIRSPTSSSLKISKPVSPTLSFLTQTCTSPLRSRTLRNAALPKLRSASTRPATDQAPGVPGDLLGRGVAVAGVEVGGEVTRRHAVAERVDAEGAQRLGLLEPGGDDLALGRAEVVVRRGLVVHLSVSTGKTGWRRLFGRGALRQRRQHPGGTVVPGSPPDVQRRLVARRVAAPGCFGRWLAASAPRLHRPLRPVPRPAWPSAPPPAPPPPREARPGQHRLGVLQRLVGRREVGHHHQAAVARRVGERPATGRLEAGRGSPRPP